MKLRKLILAIVILLFGLLLVRHLAQAEELLATLRRARPGPISLALGLQVLTLVNQPALYQSLYALVGLPARWRELAPLVWTAHFVDIVTPAAGLGGTALLIHAAQKQGLDMGRVTLANSLYFLFNFVCFVLLLGWSLVALFLWHDLKTYEIIAASIPMAGVIVAVGALWLVSARPDSFSRLVESLGVRVNALSRRLLKRQVLGEHAALDFAATFAQSSAALRTSGARLWQPSLHAMLVDGLQIAVLGACFAAFPGAGREVTLPLLIAGYSIGTLFLVVSITPQGLGVVEGVLTAIFVSFGVPLERAAVVVVAYRGLSFWLPLVAGFFASQRTLAQKEVL